MKVLFGKYRFKLLAPFLFVAGFSLSQSIEQQIRKLDSGLDSLELVKSKILSKKEDLKLNWIHQKIDETGVPLGKTKEETISHAAMVLSYNEEHEQANWVMHIIMPDIITGNTSRTNDFRPDPLIKSGSAVEADYFLKTPKSDGSSGYDYDNFGYDRGHLAPSADFRWSQKALSESYFYSNMSPQLGDFNREKWAELEDWLRAYVESANTCLIVVTAPVLNEKLPKITKSPNGVSIPELYVKAAIDPKNQRGIGFIMPNQKIKLPVESFAVSIDSIEKLIGYDFYSLLNDDLEQKLESSVDISSWFPEAEKGDAVALTKNELPKDAISTYEAVNHIGEQKKYTVCGTVVNTKKHDKGHVFVNLDKKFPNQIFSVSIFASSIKNFSYEPEVFLMNKKVCFTGSISEYNGTPSIIIENEKSVRLIGEN